MDDESARASGWVRRESWTNGRDGSKLTEYAARCSLRLRTPTSRTDGLLKRLTPSVLSRYLPGNTRPLSSSSQCPSCKKLRALGMRLFPCPARLGSAPSTQISDYSTTPSGRWPTPFTHLPANDNCSLANNGRSQSELITILLHAEQAVNHLFQTSDCCHALFSLRDTQSSLL